MFRLRLPLHRHSGRQLPERLPFRPDLGEVLVSQRVNGQPPMGREELPGRLDEPLGGEEPANEAEQLARRKRLCEEVAMSQDEPPARQVLRGEGGHEDDR